MRGTGGAFSYRVDGDGVLYLQGAGEADRQAWLAMVFEMISERRFRTDAPILMDLTGLTTALPPSSIAALTEDLCALVTDNRIAIVIATESASANAGDDAMLVDDRMSTFTSIADARRWLHVREA